VLVGYGAKMGQDWWTAKRARQQADEALWSPHRQQLYLPLLGATRELEAGCRTAPGRAPGRGRRPA